MTRMAEQEQEQEQETERKEDEWMLVDVEKFQESLEQSLQMSSSSSSSSSSSEHKWDKSKSEVLTDEEEGDNGEEGDSTECQDKDESAPRELFESCESVATSSTSSSLGGSHSTVHSTNVSAWKSVDEEECSGDDLTKGNVSATAIFEKYYEHHALSSSGQQCLGSLSESANSADEERVRYLESALEAALQEVDEMKTKNASLQEELRQQQGLIEDLIQQKNGGSPLNDTDKQAVTSLQLLANRLLHLEREVRQVRLLKERGSGQEKDKSSAWEEETHDLCDDVSITSVLPGLVAQLDENMKELENEVIPLVSSLLGPKQRDVASQSNFQDLKISLNNFRTNDIALFFPTPKGDYLAFNIGAPYHYLSSDSKALIGQDVHFKKLYVLGRIIMKETHCASDSDDSPKGLNAGMQYYSLSVASVSDQF